MELPPRYAVVVGALAFVLAAGGCGGSTAPNVGAATTMESSPTEPSVSRDPRENPEGAAIMLGHVLQNRVFARGGFHSRTWPSATCAATEGRDDEWRCTLVYVDDRGMVDDRWSDSYVWTWDPQRWAWDLSDG